MPDGDDATSQWSDFEGSDGGDEREYADRDLRERYRDQVSRPPPNYRDGPEPHITDAVFSLIILIYVTVIFVFMFFSFCWKEPKRPPPDPAHKNIPMITSMLEEMEKQEQEAAEAAAAAAAAAAVANEEDLKNEKPCGESHELQEKPLMEECAGGGNNDLKLPPIDKVVVNVEKSPEEATQV